MAVVRQRIDLPADAFSRLRSFIYWRFAWTDSTEIDSGLHNPGSPAGTERLRQFGISINGNPSINFWASPDGDSRQDLSDAWERNGQVVIEFGGQSYEMSVNNDDSDPYSLTPNRALANALFATAGPQAATLILVLEPPLTAPVIEQATVTGDGSVRVRYAIPDVDIDRVTEIEYQVDGGAWQRGTLTRLGLRPVTTPEQDASDDYVPPGWTPDPQGIDEEHPFEYQSLRHKESGVFSKFGVPTLARNYGRDGQPAPPTRPVTIVNLAYDTVPAGLPAGAGEYVILNSDGARVTTAAEAAAESTITMQISGIDADDRNLTDTYFYDLKPGDTAVLYRDDWYIAWRMGQHTGPTAARWTLPLTLVSTHAAPPTELNGLAVRIGFDRLPSALTDALTDGTLEYDSVENLNLEIYPGNTHVTFFWDVNSGTRSLDSDVYKIGTRIRYRAKGTEEWMLVGIHESSPETVPDLQNGTTYEFEFRIEYRIPPNYAPVYGDIYIVEAIPVNRPDEVLAEYLITAGTWADADGTPAFVGYFQADDVYAAPPPVSGAGKLKVVHGHPRLEPLGALVFEQQQFGGEGGTINRYFNLVYGRNRRGQGVKARNDRNAFRQLRIVGNENLELTREGASFNIINMFQGSASVWTWSVDTIEFISGVNYRVQILRFPPPLPAPVEAAFLVVAGTDKTLYWTPPRNHLEAEIRSYRIRTRVSGTTEWTVRAAAQAPDEGVNTYRIPQSLTGNFEIEIVATGLAGAGHARVISSADQRDILEHFELPEPNNFTRTGELFVSGDNTVSSGAINDLTSRDYGRTLGTIPGQGRRMDYRMLRFQPSLDDPDYGRRSIYTRAFFDHYAPDGIIQIRTDNGYKERSSDRQIIPYTDRFTVQPGSSPPFGLARPSFDLGIAILRKMNATRRLAWTMGQSNPPSGGQSLGRIYRSVGTIPIAFKPADLIPLNIYDFTHGRPILQGWGLRPPWDSTVDVYLTHSVTIIGSSAA